MAQRMIICSADDATQVVGLLAVVGVHADQLNVRVNELSRVTLGIRKTQSSAPYDLCHIPGRLASELNAGKPFPAP